MIRTYVCEICEKEYEINARKVDWERWDNNEDSIQNCFPYLSADERELILSGICGKCFDALFGDED